MAEGDDEAVVVKSPIQHLLHDGAVRQVVHRAVPTGDENCQVVGILTEVGGDVLQVQGALELGLELFVGFSNGRVVAGEGPEFQLDGVAAQGSDVHVKTCGVHVVQRQQHLHRVVAGREEGAIAHHHVAFFCADHQDLPASTGVLTGVANAIEVGARGHVLRQGIRGREKRVVLRRIGCGSAVVCCAICSGHIEKLPQWCWDC